MQKEQILKESANFIKSVNDSTVELLRGLSEEKQSVKFEEVEQYEQFKIAVAEGFVDKNLSKYSITEKGRMMLEGYSLYKDDVKKFEKLITEDKEGTEYVRIKYKKHDFETDTICTEIAKFELDVDKTPIVVVEEDVYANLIHRTKGQHWKQYLGEEGRQLIRQKKLDKFYVQSEKTGRKYLYII